MAKPNKGKGFAALRRALIDRTKWSPYTLSRRVRAVKARLAMNTKVAQAIVAHGEGLRPDRFLDGSDLADVQQTMAKLPGGAPPVAAGPRPKRARGPATRVMHFKAFGIKTADPFLEKVKLDEAVEMSKAYPVLYVLENSLRAVIRGVMEAKFGVDWWDKALTSANALKMKGKVEDRLKKEDDQSWHQRRGAHKIDYVDLTDLLVVAQSKKDVFFPRLLGQENWFQSLIEQTAPSRNVVCHMNPLSNHSVTALGVRLAEWENHLAQRKAEIQEAMKPAATGPVGA